MRFKYEFKIYQNQKLLLLIFSVNISEFYIFGEILNFLQISIFTKIFTKN